MGKVLFTKTQLIFGTDQLYSNTISTLVNKQTKQRE